MPPPGPASWMTRILLLATSIWSSVTSPTSPTHLFRHENDARIWALWACGLLNASFQANLSRERSWQSKDRPLHKFSSSGEEFPLIPWPSRNIATLKLCGPIGLPPTMFDRFDQGLQILGLQAGRKGRDSDSSFALAITVILRLDSLPLRRVLTLLHSSEYRRGISERVGCSPSQ